MTVKNKLLTFLISLLIIGCTDRYEVENGFDDINAVKFRTIVDRDPYFTRGLPVDSVNGLKSVYVYGYYTGNGDDNTWAKVGADAVPNFFDSQEVTNASYQTSNTSSWTYSPTIYWPAFDNAYITFWAYSPVASSSNGLTLSETKGGLTIEYEAPSTCIDQPDFMMSVPAIDKTNGTVDFNMQHMLACIGFSAKGTMQQITSITVKNVVVSGTVSYNSSSNALEWSLGDPTTTTYSPAVNDTTLSAGYVPVITTDGYLMLPPQTLASDAEITVTLDNSTSQTYSIGGNKWTEGQKVNYTLDYIITLDSIAVGEIQTSYVGAYWRYNETGERVIRMNNTGAWTATIVDVGTGWSTSDILIDYLPESYDKAIGTALPSTILQMDSTAGVVKGSGDIAFRIGLKEGTTLSSASSTPRYALAMIKYDGTKNHLIFLRQGEAAASVCGSALISPYNLSANKSSGSSTYELADYPSQAGGYQQWSTAEIVYPVTGSSGDTYPDSLANTSSIPNLCPSGYKLPTYNDFAPLLSDAKTVGGFYADGYFDRIAFQTHGFGSSNIIYVSAADNTAFPGGLFYNIDTYASVFFPYGGRRAYVNIQSTCFDITYNGLEGWYWTTTLTGDASSNAYTFQVSNQNTDSNATKVEVSFQTRYIRKDCNSIRPIGLVTSPNEIDGTLEGFTDDEGW